MREYFKTKRGRITFVLLAVLTSFIILQVVANVTGEDNSPKEEKLSTITSIIADKSQSNSIKEVVLEDGKRTVLIDFKDENKRDLVSSYPELYASTIIEMAEKNELTVAADYNNPNDSVLNSLLRILPLIFILAILYFMFSGTLGGGRGFKPHSESTNVKFKDIAGADEAVEDLQEIVEFLKNPKKFKAIGAKAPKGALLVGPPGTGKTLIAKAVAGEAGVPFFATSGSDFLDMFAGVGAKRVKNLFKEAKKHPAAIVFIDEIDAVGSKRTSDGGGVSQEHNRIVNSLLTQMDGFEETNVIVIAATNSVDKLDEALIRPGRFDRKVSVDLPDWHGRMGILTIHTEGKPLAADVDLAVIGKSTTGMAGADLANLVNEALINAVRSNRKEANTQDFMEALSTVTIGRAKHSAVMTDSDRHVTAVHEAGHAVAALAVNEIPDPSHVTVVPRGFSGGHTKLQESEDKFKTSKALKGQLVMILGGLVGERIALGDITQGPGHDLQAATDLATQMVTRMGMGETLTVVDAQTLTVNSNIGESVRTAVEKLIQEALDRAEVIFNEENWKQAHAEMVEQLLEFDSLDVKEIQAIKARALSVQA